MTPEELVERYAAMVYNLALRLTGDRTEAEDLTQESLLKAVQGLPGFRGEADPGTWVYRITVNAWKNLLRAKARWRFLRFFGTDDDPESVASEPVDCPEAIPGPEAQAEAADLKARIESALAELTPEERAVLVLRELDGRSYAEIAESLGIPLGTVKSRLVRARALLAERLEGGMDGA
ncbi:MAG: sigma-70 family RNA polymerase sigma factor [Elusimicrobia bacterium]|nr:sigma-70 family RNA polymerase sigma factor [Elusimicrobiota bacterium]